MALSAVFIHTPRTGGTSVSSAFAPVFEERRFTVDYAGLLKGFKEKIVGNLERGVLVAGHFTLGDLRRFVNFDTERSVNFSALRDPVERIDSLFRFCRKHPHALGPIYEATKDRDLGYFANYIHDHHPIHGRSSQCFFLSGEVSFAAAKSALLADFDVVALSHRLDSLVPAVAHHLRCNAELPAARLNATRPLGADDEEAADPVPKSVRGLIQRLNSEDVELNDYVHQSWDGLWINAGRETRRTDRTIAAKPKAGASSADGHGLPPEKWSSLK